MAITDTNRQAFQSFIKDNEIDQTQLTQDDAQEFIDKWTIARFPAKPVVQEPQFKTEDTFLDESITWTQPEAIEPVVPEVTPEIIPEIVPEITPEVVEETIVPEQVVKEDVRPQEEIEAQQLANEQEKENKANQMEDKALNQFNSALKSWDRQVMADIVNGNPRQRAVFNASAKEFYQNSGNVKYVQKYSGATNDQMYSAFKEWTITPWSEQYGLLPPEQRASFNKFLKTKDNTQELGSFNVNAKENTVDFTAIETIVAGMFNTDILGKAQDIRNNSEINDLTSKLNSKGTDIETFDRNFQKEQDKLEKALANTGYSPAIIRERLRDNATNMRDERYDMMLDYRTIQWDLASEKSSIDSDIKVLEMQDASSKSKYQFLYNEYKEDRASMQAVAKLEFEAQNKEKSTQQALYNEMLLIDYKESFENTEVSIDKWESRYDGIYALKSDGTAELVVNGGQSKIWDTFVKTRIWSDGEPITEVFDVDWNSYGATNNSWLSDTQISLLNASDGAIIPTRLSKTTNPNGGKECAEYVNDIFASSVWVRMGNTYQSKLDVATESEGKPWSLAVWQPDPNNAEFSKYGHAGIIVGEEWDDWIIKSSNFEWDGRISTVSVPKSIISGYKSTDVFSKPNPNYSREAENWAKNIQSWWDFKITSIQNKELRTEVSNYLAENPIELEEDNPIIQGLKTQSQLAWELLADESIARTVSGAFQTNVFEAFTWSKGQFLGKIQFLLDEEPLNKLISVKEQWGTFWALSDKELALLTKSSSLLNSAAERDNKGNITWFRMSEDDFIDNIKVLQQNYNKAISKKTWNEEVFYTDTDWIEYSQDSLKKELVRMVQSWEATAKELKEWKERNNIILN